eukprot:scaffold135740_cov55-Prasinocladus_malaysianus.AAC.1
MAQLKVSSRAVRSVGNWWKRLGGLEVNAAQPSQLDVVRLRNAFPYISTLRLQACRIRSVK